MSTTKERRILKTECSICGFEGKIMFCAKCETISYCSQQCQKIDWPSHKSLCSLLKVQVSERRNLMKLINLHTPKIILGLTLLRKVYPELFKKSSKGESLIPNIIVNNSGIKFNSSMNVQHLIIEKNTVSINFILVDDDGKYIFVESDDHMKSVISIHQNVPLNEFLPLMKTLTRNVNFEFLKLKFNRDFFDVNNQHVC